MQKFSRLAMIKYGLGHAASCRNDVDKQFKCTVCCLYRAKALWYNLLYLSFCACALQGPCLLFALFELVLHCSRVCPVEIELPSLRKGEIVQQGFVFWRGLSFAAHCSTGSSGA